MTRPQTHAPLLFALRRVLRSLARLLIHTGIRFDEFAGVARSVYVESAIRDWNHMTVPSRERIAAFSGLTAREVDYQIDNEGALPSSDPAFMLLVAEVLRVWHTNPRFLGPYGIPLELTFETPDDRCFRSVAALVDPRANPKAILEELVRTGAVIPSGEEHFRAVSRSLVLQEVLSPERIEYQEKGLSRLATTLEYNMNPRHVEKRLDRRVSADRGLPVRLVPEFEKYAREKATALLLELDNWLASHASSDSDDDDRIDTGINVFLYAELPGEKAPLATLVSTPKSKTSRSR